MGSERRAIVTLTIGDYFTEMAKHTHPLIKKYAKKCVAEFVIIKESRLTEKFGLPTYEKFQIFDLFDKYDRILFIDTDIVITPDAPNLFELVPDDCFAAVNEESYSMAPEHKRITQEVLGVLNWDHCYFNSGVMLIPSQSKSVLNYNSEEICKWTSHDGNNDHVMSDQPIINYLSQKQATKFYELNYKFNRTRVLKDTHNRFSSYFIHFAGPSGHRYGAKLDQIRKDVSVCNSTLNYKLSKRFPLYRYICDRLDQSFFSYLGGRIFGEKYAK